MQKEEKIEGLSRYKSVKLAPSFLKEVFSHYKRRLIEFLSTTKEFVKLLGPFLITVNFITLLEIILTIVFTKIGDNNITPDNKNEIR